MLDPLCVTFVLSGERLDPSVVTFVVGEEPRVSYHCGDSLPSGDTARNGKWESSHFSSNADQMSEYIRRVLNRLGDGLSGLRSHAGVEQILVRIAVSVSAAPARLFLERGTILTMSKLNAELQIAIMGEMGPEDEHWRVT